MKNALAPNTKPLLGLSSREMLVQSSAQPNRPLLSGGQWFELDGIAQVFEPPDEALGVGGRGATLEMIRTEVLIESSVFEHVIGGGED